MLSFAKELKTASMSILLLFFGFVLDIIFRGKLYSNNIGIVVLGFAIQIPITTILLIKMRSITNNSSRLLRAVKFGLSYGLCLSTSLTLDGILRTESIDIIHVIFMFFINVIMFIGLHYFLKIEQIRNNNNAHDYYSEAQNKISSKR